MTLTRSSLLLFALSVSSLLQASTITQAPTRIFLSGLGLADDLQWGVAGDEGNSIASGSIRTSTPTGINVTLNNGGLVIAVEGSAGNGNFTNGDVLLLSNGALGLVFASPIQGFGFQIQRLALGAFTATMNIFGAGNVLFDTVTVGGTSTFGGGDDTAPFLGFYSDASDVVRVAISVSPTIGGDADFAINNATILNNLDAIPEPQTISLIGCGFAVLALVRQRRK